VNREMVMVSGGPLHAYSKALVGNCCVYVIFNFYMRCYLVVFFIYLSRGYASAANAVIFLGLDCYAADFIYFKCKFF